ncbi:MAG: hypothetical protein CMJ19_06290 [Phycisphaeraceae bacterium]|nr:hypothetical protein [Phycisphaeraceae bacterium]
MRWLIIFFMLMLTGIVTLSSHAQTPEIEPEYGVVFFLPDTTEQAIDQLKDFQQQGFNSIKIPSWAWTVPSPGSTLAAKVSGVLDWCDAHQMKVWLLENIQYGSASQGGDLNRVLADPLYKRSVLEPWLELLKNRICFQGMLLGNEVGSGHFLSKLNPTNPQYMAAFQDYLLKTHGDLPTLNRRWKCSIQSMAVLPALTRDSPGFIDYQRFAHAHFATLYDAWLEQLIKPSLGSNLLYGSKASDSPYLQRACQSFTVCSWDDMMANHPPHIVRLMTDTVQQILGRPVFNSELHLYHDKVAFVPNRRLTRYRYLLSAIQGEWKTASYDNQSWTKEKIKVQHRAAVNTIAECKRLEPWLKRFNDRTKAPVAMLVTEGNMHWSSNPDVPNEGPAYGVTLAYPWLASLGHPWRYVLDQDLSSINVPQVLIISSPWLTAQTIQSLKQWPRQVRIIAIGSIPVCDEWFVPHPSADRQWLHERIQCVDSWDTLHTRLPAVEGLPEQATQVIMGRFQWWSRDRGSYRFKFPFAQLEVRHLQTRDSELVLMITHDRDVQLTVDLPWVRGARVVEHTGSNPGRLINPHAVSIGPNDVRLFEYKR